MSKKSFNHPRRKFLANSTKVLAGAALTSFWPGPLRVAQALVTGDVAQGRSPVGHYSSRGISMLTVKAVELGSQLFAQIPRALRSDALQIECLLAGVKPACRLSLTVQALQSSIDYLKSLNCSFVIEQVRQSEQAYAHMSPQRRETFRAQSRVRVYLARSAADARALAKLESDKFDYRAIGLALGYPKCCVEAAVKKDQTYFDEEQQVWRQTNLNSVAVRASTAADFRCNSFLLESDIQAAGPASAIAHYPCKLDCPESIALAQSTLERCARTWPIWAITLCELMRSPVLYWHDDAWPAEYWDEYCGLALIGADQHGAQEWSSALPAVLLGTDGTPSGRLPKDVVGIKVAKDQLLLRRINGDVVRLSLKENGYPSIIDWQKGTVKELA